MASIDLILNEIDEILETSTGIPFNNKRLTDVNAIRDLIDDIRLNMPAEIKQAKAVAEDRKEILTLAKKEADDIIRKAEERAKALIDQETIVRQANAKGIAILNEANQKANEMISNATKRSQEMVTQATQKANETVTQANHLSKEMKQAAYDFSNMTLTETTEVLEKYLENVKTTHKALNEKAKEAARQSRAETSAQ